MFRVLADALEPRPLQGALTMQESQYRALETELETAKRLHLEQLERKDREHTKQLTAALEEGAKQSKVAAKQASSCLAVSINALRSELEASEQAWRACEENANKASNESIGLINDLKHVHSAALAATESKARDEKQVLSHQYDLHEPGELPLAHFRQLHM